MNAASINHTQEQKLHSAHARAGGVAIGNNNLRLKVARRVGVVELPASPSAKDLVRPPRATQPPRSAPVTLRMGLGRRPLTARLTGSVRLVAWDELLLLPVPDDDDDDEQPDRSATESWR
jgi:hypothetical protein